MVPGSSVHGQNVTTVATMGDRRIRYVPGSAAIVLTGVPLTQDFDLEGGATGSSRSLRPPANRMSASIDRLCGSHDAVDARPRCE